jgi:hypothetical protein
MKAYEKVRQALGDLLSAEVKDADGATCSASTHRNAAIVLLHGLVPDYKLGVHQEHLKQALRQAHEEMRLLGCEDRYMSGEHL